MSVKVTHCRTPPPLVYPPISLIPKDKLDLARTGCRGGYIQAVGEENQVGKKGRRRREGKGKERREGKSRGKKGEGGKEGKGRREGKRKVKEKRIGRAGEGKREE